MTVSWAPTLAEVGSIVPLRTFSTVTPGNETPLNTFNTNTIPDGTTVQSYIDRTVNDALAAVASVPSTLEQSAHNAVMWRVAADIELAYAERNADVTALYAQLDARAKYEWKLFLTAAEDSGGTAEATVPFWYMPNPVSWGDTNV